MTLPDISIVMSVYNAQSDVRRAIESICNQTFRNFEFIIIDDGSTDKTLQILNAYAAQEPRIRIHTQNNAGLTKALNTGVKLAAAPLIARQDADDFSHPERLQAQFEFMKAHPKINLLGSAGYDLHPDGTRTFWPAISHAELQKSVYLKTPFPHSSAIMRTAILKELGGYDENFFTAQDMELWMRFAKRGEKIFIIST
jgi:glycosyltransferase involved in cell wall biosynthesis